MKKYITTTLPYVNARPHVGFALEIVQADVLARFWRLQGEDVFFTTGTDEHGQKVYQKAQEAGMSAQEYTDDLVKNFKNLLPLLTISNSHFIRTTDEHHKKAAQEFWRRVQANGDIYKKNYQVKYCVGCELSKTDSELDENGCCPLHPNLPLETIEEENYFFRFSNYGEKLLEFYKNNPQFVVPSYRINEMVSLIENKGLQDFSISRLKEKMPWGVEVPGDDTQVMYVWFDALTNYISVTGWPEEEDFSDAWPGLQVAGKDQVRQQAAMWQAMLMSAGLLTSSQIFFHGFITADGQKMSKSLGNVVDPVEYIERYGIDALRYYLLRHVHPFEDSDFTRESFEESYTAHLVNGVGNLTSRLLTMVEKQQVELPEFVEKEIFWSSGVPEGYVNALQNFRFDEAADVVFGIGEKLDGKIQETKPFALVKKDPSAAAKILQECLLELWEFSLLLEPFLPTTAWSMQEVITVGKKPEVPLFPRLEK